MSPLYDWYYITNLADFIASALPSREIILNFPNFGLQTILLTSGDTYSLIFNNVMLSIGLNNKNPFTFDSYAVYYDSEQGVWLGILHGS